MLLFGEEMIRRVDLTQSASFKNVVMSTIFKIKDYIYGVEKTSLFQNCQ